VERQGGDSYWRQCWYRCGDRNQVGEERRARRGTRQERERAQGIVFRRSRKHILL